MLKSLGKESVTYVGYTNDLKKRINLHNNNKGAKFTRGRKWKLIYKEKLNSKKEAISREYYIKKNRTLRNKLKKLNEEYYNSKPSIDDSNYDDLKKEYDLALTSPPYYNLELYFLLLGMVHTLMDFL